MFPWIPLRSDWARCHVVKQVMELQNFIFCHAFDVTRATDLGISYVQRLEARGSEYK